MFHTPRMTHPVPSEFLRDESRTIGTAEAIVFPHNTAEVIATLRATERAGLPITTQGARTGIVAGAVPPGGVILNLSRMDQCLGCFKDNADRHLLRVEPGVPLLRLQRDLANSRTFSKKQFFPPDPTEPSATLGGMAACNASGARSFAYGATRHHIEALTAVLADGDTLSLRRGREQALDRHFALTTVGGRCLSGELPRLAMPRVKNAAGYFIRPDMDLIDLLLGSEGTLAILTELELRLSPAPAGILGIVAFFSEAAQALALVEQLRNRSSPRPSPRLTAIEYFDEHALRLAFAGTKQSGMRLPAPAAAWRHAIYFEWTVADDPATALDFSTRVVMAAGGTPVDTWVAHDAVSLDRMKAFRHATPEQINALIAERARTYPGLTKLGTDFSVPDTKLRPLVSLYKGGLAATGLEHAIFGHIGNNHLHVNILPRNLDEYETGKRLIAQWADQVIAWGGSISAEHGVGRLKRALLFRMIGPAGIAAMRQIKHTFDPRNRLNPGVLFRV